MLENRFFFLDEKYRFGLKSQSVARFASTTYVDAGRSVSKVSTLH